MPAVVRPVRPRRSVDRPQAGANDPRGVAPSTSPAPRPPGPQPGREFRRASDAPAAAARFAGRSSARPDAPGNGARNRKPDGPKPEPRILFQTYFKSIGPRTYAAQVKEASNRNQFLVLTEGKRDPKTDQVRKTSLYVYSEDFGAFFRMVKEAAEWIKANPLPEDVKRKRDAFWARPKRKGS